MARARVIHPQLFTHEALFEAEKRTGLPIRLAWAGLPGVCDREGRFEWKPRVLKLDVLPYDDLDFAAVLEALQHHGFIIRYEVGDRVYGYIPTFHDWQKPHPREAKSDVPAPPKADTKKKEGHGNAEGAPKASHNQKPRPTKELGDRISEGEPKASPRQEDALQLQSDSQAFGLSGPSDSRDPRTLEPAVPLPIGSGNRGEESSEPQPVGIGAPPETTEDEQAELNRRREARRRELFPESGGTAA